MLYCLQYICNIENDITNIIILKTYNYETLQPIPDHERRS
uniref:Uncharacterized protein n=1 Tax=virus sp. ctdtS1 TaxID=2826808 RepID=A0A8S5NGM3_9VIRU|nr:MAG TPA: hypothetical protein [virus sp. ctdtS1]